MIWRVCGGSLQAVWLGVAVEVGTDATPVLFLRTEGGTTVEAKAEETREAEGAWSQGPHGVEADLLGA